MEGQWAGLCRVGFAHFCPPQCLHQGRYLLLSADGQMLELTGLAGARRGWGQVVEELGSSWGLFYCPLMCVLSPEIPDQGRAWDERVPGRAQAALDWSLCVDQHGSVGTWAGPGWL